MISSPTPTQKQKKELRIFVDTSLYINMPTPVTEQRRASIIRVRNILP